MLQYTGSQRVRHDRVTEQQQPVFLPAKRHGQRSLVGYTVHEVAKSQDMTERTKHHISRPSKDNRSLPLF